MGRWHIRRCGLAACVPGSFFFLLLKGRGAKKGPGFENGGRKDPVPRGLPPLPRIGRPRVLGLVDYTRMFFFTMGAERIRDFLGPHFHTDLRIRDEMPILYSVVEGVSCGFQMWTGIKLNFDTSVARVTAYRTDGDPK